MSADLIQSFGRLIDVLTPAGNGEYVDGYYQDPIFEQTGIIASVQDLTSKELLLMPEGERMKGWKKIYTTVELNTAIEGIKRPADKLVIDGKTYQVMRVQNFVDHNCMGISYWRADVVLDNGTGN